ncbi:hypothetical protein [Thiosocius teredinicola]|uniref:hypothetical protein n=1 Tax=Thiosocius teredinicola TaxID=1973002 RepID=UPI0013DDFF96
MHANENLFPICGAGVKASLQKHERGRRPTIRNPHIRRFVSAMQTSIRISSCQQALPSGAAQHSGLWRDSAKSIFIFIFQYFICQFQVQAVDLARRSLYLLQAQRREA